MSGVILGEYDGIILYSHEKSPWSCERRIHLEEGWRMSERENIAIAPCGTRVNISDGMIGRNSSLLTCKKCFNKISKGEISHE